MACAPTLASTRSSAGGGKSKAVTRSTEGLSLRYWASPNAAHCCASFVCAAAGRAAARRGRASKVRKSIEPSLASFHALGDRESPKDEFYFALRRLAVRKTKSYDSQRLRRL